MLASLLMLQLLRPDAALTPGLADPKLTIAVLCSPDFRTKNYRSVGDAEKLQVFARYGVDRTKDRYEIDHLISIELGGTNDLTNLWPQSYTTQPLNATVKDGLENVLHAAVCAGKVPLADAQKAIATDWVAAYHTWVCNDTRKLTAIMVQACK